MRIDLRVDSVDARSSSKAIERARRFPNPMGDGKDAEIEVRQLYELDDFAPSPSLNRMRELDAGR